MNKNINNDNKKIVIIIMSIVLLLALVTIVVLLLKNQGNEELKNNPTNNSSSISSNNKDDMTSVVNPDYNGDMSGASYYTKELIIYNNNLYAIIDETNEYTKELINKAEKINNKKAYLLKEKIEKVFIVEEGNSGYYFSFAVGINGELYYINNHKYANMDILEIVLIPELNNIDNIHSKYSDDEEVIEAYATDINGKDYSLNEIITKYSKLS